MGDAVEIEFFDSGTLGDEIVHMQQVRTGQLDVIPIGSDAVQLDSKWAVFDIPFLSADREARQAVLASREYGTQNNANLLAEITELAQGKVEVNDVDVAAFQAAAPPIVEEIGKGAGEEFTAAVMAAIR